MNLRLVIQTSLLVILLSSASWAQSQQEVDRAGNERAKTADAEKKAKAEAETAKKNAETKERELKDLKKTKADVEENLDANKTADRLEKEIKQIEEKLKKIDKVKQKVVNGIVNPGVKTGLTSDESDLRTEALGGSSVPVVPDSIRQSFDDKKAELQRQLEEKKKQLKKAKEDAEKKKLDADEQKKAQEKIDDLEEQIRKKEKEVEGAKAEAERKAREAKAAEEADAAAYDKFDKLRKAKQKADELAQAKKDVKKAIEGVRRAAQALKDKERDLTKNLNLAKSLAGFFRFLNGLLNFMDKLTDLLDKVGIDTKWQNPDLTKAIEQGSKALDAIDRILNNPKSTLSQAINEQLRSFRDALQAALNRLKAANARLERLTAGTTTGTTGDQRLGMAPRPPGKRPTMLKKPYLALTKDRSTQLYAAAENALDRGHRGDFDQVSTLIADYRVDAASNAPGLDAIDLAEANLLSDLATEVQQRYDSLATQVGQIDGLNIPNADVIEATVVANPELDNQLSSIVWDAFGDELLQNRAAPPDSGAVVLKGNARNSTGGGARTLTLSLSPPADQPTTPEKTVKVDVDEGGDFETTLAPGWKPSQLLIGGRDQETTIFDDPISAGLPDNPPWRNPSLTPEQQQNVLTIFDRFDQWCAAILTGQPQAPRPPSENGAIRGWRLHGVVEGSEPPQDRMPAPELFDAAIILADNQTFRIDLTIPDSNVVTVAPASNPTIVAQADPNAPDNVQSFILGGLDDDPTTLTLPTTPLREKIGVVSSIPLIADPGQVAEAEATLVNDLQDRITGHVREVVGAGPAIKVEVADSRTIPAGNGTMVISTFEVTVTNESGAPVAVDRGQLNDRIQNDPQMPVAGVMLPRDAQVTPPDPYFTSKGSWGEEYHDQWALRRSGFVTKAGEGVWPAALKNCTVAVIGSGVDWTHPELSGQMWVNRAEDPYNGVDDDGNGYIDDVFGWNFRDDTNDVLDRGGHDTHVAGVIAARWSRQGIAGANPAARIMALKVANFLGQADSVAISRAIYYAVNHGARVINISYNGKTPSPLEQHAIKYAASRNVLVIVASGNQGADADGMALSGNPNVVTVAGSTTKDGRAGFSNFGLPIDLSAPAMDVLSLRAQRTDFLLYTGDNPNYEGGTAVIGEDRSLYRASGTSFAAPLVAGAASLIISQRPELTGQQVRNMLIMSASDLATPGWDQNTGAGVLNVAQALTQSPDSLLLVRITKIAAARRNNQVVVNVNGDLDATGERVRRVLQVAHSASPKEADWQTIAATDEPLGDAVSLGTIPSSTFNQRGVWSIRVVAEDEQRIKREARASLTIQ